MPGQINLWVSGEPYLRDQGIADCEILDSLIDSLPETNRHLICVRWVPNTGPYRKLIPILREAGPEDVIVTADDDIFYGRDWLSWMLGAYHENGGKPVAARVRSKKVNFLGKETSYLHWKIIHDPIVVRENYVVTFGGGAVLTRAMFREVDIADDSFLKVASTADDLWYSKLLQLNNNEVVVVPVILEQLNFICHNDGLINHNFPKILSLAQKIRFMMWDKFLGFFGASVCGNDVAHRKIDRYFRMGS